MHRWKRGVAALLIGTAVVAGGTMAAGCSDDDPDDPEMEIEGEPGDPTQDPENPLDPTIPSDG